MNPVKPHPTWKIHDSSKLICFMGCPRRYFYRYVLGWTPDVPNIHLEFGKAWHKAMDHLIRNGCVPGSVPGAFNEFMKVYRQSFGPAEDEDQGPKTPDNALMALNQYVQEFGPQDRWTPIDVEIPGTVDLGNDMTLALRLDLLVRDAQSKIVIIDHKTTTRLSQVWLAKWPMSFQLHAYLHCALCLFDATEVYGAIVNGAIFRKPPALKKDGTPYANASKGNEFQRVVIVPTNETMQQWLETARYYYKWIMWEFEQLELADAAATTLRAFPLCPENCDARNTACPYIPFCSTRSNPLQLVEQYPEEPPVGFRREYWDPTHEEGESED